MTNGADVQRFEEAFAEYVGAEYAIAMCNGTATLHTALVALGVKPHWHCPDVDLYAWDADADYTPDGKNSGTPVAVPPLTMASTTIAVLHAGGVPVFVDVDPDTWLMVPDEATTWVAVDLFGLITPRWGVGVVVDAAQTLRAHDVSAPFTSYSFQASKILPLGEGGMLVTDDADLARGAREFSSLGYEMGDGPRIDPATLKSPDYPRHHSLGYNYRMADAVARLGLNPFDCSQSPAGQWDAYKRERQAAAMHYREAVAGCPWITPQHVPEGWTHDYWAYAVALESAELWQPFVAAIERHGGERPYACWRVTYQEPAFRHLTEDGTCPVAEDLQPRLVQFQTNFPDAEKNADAVAAAIKEINGSR